MAELTSNLSFEVTGTIQLTLTPQEAIFLRSLLGNCPASRISAEIYTAMNSVPRFDIGRVTVEKNYFSEDLIDQAMKQWKQSFM